LHPRLHQRVVRRIHHHHHHRRLQLLPLCRQVDALAMTSVPVNADGRPLYQVMLMLITILEAWQRMMRRFHRGPESLSIMLMPKARAKAKTRAKKAKTEAKMVKMAKTEAKMVKTAKTEATLREQATIRPKAAGEVRPRRAGGAVAETRHRSLMKPAMRQRAGHEAKAAAVPLLPGGRTPIGEVVAVARQRTISMAAEAKTLPQLAEAEVGAREVRQPTSLRTLAWRSHKAHRVQGR